MTAKFPKAIRAIVPHAEKATDLDDDRLLERDFQRDQRLQEQLRKDKIKAAKKQKAKRQK